MQYPETGQAFADFAFAMRQFIRKLTASRPLDVGMTFTVGGLAGMQAAPPSWLTSLFAVADVTPLTYYPLIANFSVDADWTAVNSTLHAGIALLPPTACLVLQELGCPAGYGNASSTDGSSQALQAAFYSLAVGELRRMGRESKRPLRGLSAYEFVDPPAAVCAAEAAYYNISLPAFTEYLCTLGIVGADGAPKQAFHAFLDAIGAA